MSLPHPTPPTRAVVTSLINAITSSAPSETAAETSSAENPLKTLPQSHRPLLVSLHVLFPSLVLPALDLLDRNLVTRVVAVDADADPANPAGEHHHRHLDDQDGNDRDSGTTPARDRREPAAFHLVRSVASTMSRRTHAGAATATAATMYLVHLNAWNCSCAEFAYEAFPASDGGDDLEILDVDANQASWEASLTELRFGGSSLDGIDHGSVPCCKHLLACLLSEQWGDILGSYLIERRMSREEMAGVVAEI